MRTMGSMTPLATYRATLGWPLREVARRLGCDPNLCQRWEAGTARTPPAVLAWLRALAHCVERHPPPEDWRTRGA